MGLLIDIKVFLGYEICPKCGSERITKHGFAESNMRYSCLDCGQTTYITGLI